MKLKFREATKPEKGYTLLEFLVAIGVFLVIVTIAVGGFVRALRTHRQAMALMAANSNISAVLEQMAREIRTGSSFSLSGPALIFDSAEQGAVSYELTGTSLTRTSVNPMAKLTDDNVIVDYLRFNLISNPSYPPRIVINIGVRPNQLGVNTVINLQTTVSTRNF